MSVIAPVALCFILYITVFILFILLVPELKIRNGLWASVLGLSAVIPIAFVEYIVFSLPIFTSQTYFSVLITSLVFNGLIEETLKMVFMLLLPYRKLKLQSFFACSILCGLVFGSFESVIYMLTDIQKISSSGTAVVFNLILIRMCTAVLIHTFCTGFSGLYLWSFRRKKTLYAPFFYAVVLHGLYNFFASHEKPFYWFIIPVILFAIIECRMQYLKQKENKLLNS